MELKDQDVPKETKLEFEKLKEDYPEGIFTQQSGYWSTHNWLLCMLTQGTHPPFVKKPYTFPLKHYSWVQQEIETLERAGIIKKSPQSMGQSNCCCSQEIQTW